MANPLTNVVVSTALSFFILVMRKSKIDSAGMDINPRTDSVTEKIPSQARVYFSEALLSSKIQPGHGGAFNMPSRTTFATPRSFPARLINNFFAFP